ncbi:MAG: AI-2E family transporter [Patescibacteria group bacterium]
MALRNIIQSAKSHIKKLRGKVKELSESAHKRELLEMKEMEEKAHAIKKKDHVQHVALDVSAATVAKVVLVILVLLGAVKFLDFISDILLIFFISLLLSAAFDPLVDALQRRRIPRAIGVLIVYSIVLSVLGIFISQLIPLLAGEIGQLAVRVQDLIKNVINGSISLPSFLEGLRPTMKELFQGVDISQLENYKEILLRFAQNLSDVAGSLVSTLVVVFNGFLNATLVLVLTFLMIVDETAINKFILSLFPARYAEYIMEKNSAIKTKIGNWLRGQLTLAFSMALLTYIGLFIIGLLTEPIEFTLTLGLFAGIAEFLPVIGPFLTWTAATLIVLNQDPVMVIWVTILFILLQQIEGNILIPLIMRKAVGLSPIFVIFGVLVGFKFFGILGIILAVPVTTTVAIFVKDYAEREK